MHATSNFHYITMIRVARHTCRRKDNIKIDVREIEWDDVECIILAQDRDKWRTGGVFKRINGYFVCIK